MHCPVKTTFSASFWLLPKYMRSIYVMQIGKLREETTRDTATERNSDKPVQEATCVSKASKKWGKQFKKENK